MKKKRKYYCETLNPGFYLYTSPQGSKRCHYASGEKKGNFWIHIPNNAHPNYQPAWNTLLWNCIPKGKWLGEYHGIENPTDFPLRLH